MQRTVSIKLGTNPEHDAALSALAAEFALGCNLASEIAARERVTNRVKLHHLAYYLVRERTRLGSQMACNTMRAAASAYKTLKANRRLPKDGPFPKIVFGDKGAVHFDKRTYRIDGKMLSLYTLDGRIRVPMVS